MDTRALALAALLGFGALAFGSVYAWAYLPLAAGVLVTSGAVFWRYSGTAVIERHTHVAIALPTVALAVQMVPLPQWALRAIAPGAHGFLSLFSPSYALAEAPRHSISVDPHQTVLACAAFVTLVLWTAALRRLLAREPLLPDLTRNLTVLGTAIALLGMAQQATFNGKLLWFWEPAFSSANSFGPFVNRNHFAGWMLLALAVTGGYLVALIHRPGHEPKPGLRNRLLWLGSCDATAIILTAAGALTMAISLIWTLSRSGIAGAAVAMAVLVTAACARAAGTMRRYIAAGSLAVAFLAAAAWKGADTLVAWYGDTGTLHWRFRLWADSVAPLRDFWLTGSGLNTYGTLMLVYPRSDLTVHPREAHNDYLQLAIEGGILVGIPALLLIGTLGWQIVSRLRQSQDVVTWWIRMGAVAAICGIAVQELSEFSLQIPGVALLFATCVAIAIHDPPPTRTRTGPPPYWPAGAAVAGTSAKRRLSAARKPSAVVVYPNTYRAMKR